MHGSSIFLPNVKENQETLDNKRSMFPHIWRTCSEVGSPLDHSPISLLRPCGFRIALENLSSNRFHVLPARHSPRLWILRPSSERRNTLTDILQMATGSSPTCDCLGFLASADRRRHVCEECRDVPKSSQTLKLPNFLSSRRTSPVVFHGTRDKSNSLRC
jgi:hypothetical protein